MRAVRFDSYERGNKKVIMKKAWLLLIGVLSTLNIYAADKPNILWITSEDNSISWISCYRSVNTKTPNIDKLATEGFRYLNCFDNAAVCAPTRYTWLTGMHAISCGTQEMRSKCNIPKDIVYYNKQLQKAGYFTINCSKTDYNLSSQDNPMQYWNFQGNAYPAPWRKCKKGLPFFTVLNIGESHESRAFGNTKDPRTKEMKLHPYHPDIPEMRETYAIYAKAVENMDRLVGKAVAELKKDGLYEDTIIIYNSDHGGVLPRSKRFLYSSGVHCPLIVRIPEKWKHLYPNGKKPGETVDRIVSFIDMPKTWISLAGGDVPDIYQGRIFLGPDTDPDKEYHFSWRGRADARFDCVRMVRNERFAYHKNYAPFAPAGQFLQYMHYMKATGAWEKYHKAGKTDEVTGRFFEPRVSEELYDNDKDFHNIHNLIGKKEHKKILAKLKAEMRRQQLACFDSGLLPEKIRNARAAKHNMTVYEMVRDPEIYPLEKYLDAADLALARDKTYLNTFIKNLTDDDIGMQYWAVVGLLLLEKDAAPAIDALKKIHEIAIEKRLPYLAPYSAWAIFKADKEGGENLLYKMLENQFEDKDLANVLDWMGKESLPLLRRYTSVKMLSGHMTSDVIRRSGVPHIDAHRTPAIPASAFPNGLKGEYFKEIDCKGDIVLTRTDKNIDFNWSGKLPEGLSKKDFSVRWSGKLKSTESGKHIIAASCDVSATLLIDGKPLLEGNQRKDISHIELEAGKEVDILIKHNEKRGRKAHTKLMWLLPSALKVKDF